VCGDAEDPDPAGGVLDQREDIAAGAIEEVDGEEVRRQDCLGLTAQELRPRRPVTPRRRWDPGGDQDLSHRRRRHENAEASEFTVDPPVTPPRVLPRHSQDQSPDGGTRTRAARVLVLGLAAQRRRTMSRRQSQYGLRTDEQAQARSPTVGDDVEQEHDQRPIGPRQLRSTVDLALQHPELMAQ
jgi:hypothetical protein